MKRLLYALGVIGLAILCLPVEMLAAGDTLDVAATPAGNINVVINSDTLAGGVRAHPDRVYRLGRGKYYQITEPMKINGPITIIANDSAGIRPPVLTPAILLDNSSVDHFFDLIGKGSKVVVKNLYMLSQRSDNIWLGWSDCFRPGADSVSLTLRGCVIEGFSNCAIVPSYWLKTDIQDCEFRNQAHTGSYFGGQVFRGAGNVCLDTTLFINNTFFVNSSYLIDIRGYTPLAVFDHNTVAYGMVNPLLIRQASNLHIKNNIFYSSHGYGGIPDLVINGWFLNYPDTGSSGIIQLRSNDSVSYWSKLWGATFSGPEAWVDAAHNVTAGMLDATKRVYDVRNNDWFMPTKLMAFYKAYNDTVASHDSVLVPVYGTASEQMMWLKRILYYPTWLTSYIKWSIDSGAGLISPNVKIEKTPLMLDPGFPTNVANQVDKQIDYIHQIATGTIGAVRWTFPDTLLYPITWPLPESFAYSNTTLQSAGTDGFALGDLNWFPSQKAAWTLTDVKKVENALPMEYTLSQNYPNPFNPSTVIEFSLPKQSKVTLTVYNLLGQQVATLVNATLGAGSYTTEFNASKLASGTYIYRLTADNFVKTSKMLLIK